jgi:tricorn protease
MPWFFAALTLALPALVQSASQTLLLRQPTLSDDRLAFVYAGDIWIADRSGDNPRRLTSDPADERRPHFSPDGRHIAFTAEYGDNTDVYVIAADGGEVRRLTFHPGDDIATGWSADGERVAFSSAREVANGRSGQLFEAALSGGLPTKVMEAPFFRGAWNGDELAYMAFGPAYNGLYGGSSGWRGYRGGTTPFIRILQPNGRRFERVPGERVNDIEPMWDGDTLYFISDRDGKVFNVHRYDRQSATVQRLSNETVWDVRSADVHGGVVVYEAGGQLKSLDVAGGEARELPISLPTDRPQTRPQWKDASQNIETVGISPSGKRAVITARGEVFTVPTEHGSTRNLTQTDGVREYTALWSPQGDRIAYVVDNHGEQSLAVIDQAGLEAPRSYPLGSNFHSLLEWGGDGGHIAYSDNRLKLHVLRLADGHSREIASHNYREQFDVTTSSDGRWLAFTLARPNLLKDLMLYELASGKLTQVSDGMVDVAEVAFSPDGKYLYFGASTNSGQTQVGLDLSSREQPRRLALYGLVLAADGTSPLAPRTGDENGEDDDEDEDGDKHDEEDDEEDDDDKEDSTSAKTPPPTRIDLKGLSERIVALPVAARNYSNLHVDKDGNLFYVDHVQPGASEPPGDAKPEAGNTLMRFDFDKREAKKVADGITAVTLSHDGGHLLARNAKDELLSAEIEDDIELEKVDTAGMRMRIDPRKEWAQIFHDAWRMEQAFFYASNMHGLDWAAIYDRYRPLLEHAGRREDINDLMVEMIAELQVGHNRVNGGDVHEPTGEAKSGLLGADLRVENGRYRIHKIYTGEHWNPFLQAPLARPELGIRAGDYILAVNGRELTAEDNIFERLQGTVDRQTDLTVSPTPSASRARTVVVEPTDDERMLRLWDWVESNRRRVAEATDGRVGYVYLPNTGGEGYTFFNRMFFAQVDKPALIVDERSNGGGQAANYVTDVLSRTYLSGWKDRDGLIFDTPGGAVYGPKVMLIDQDAGSGGDFLPYAFRHMNIGKLIGTRTWGGLIGIAANPSLIDGGSLVVPFFRFFTPDGQWAIENEGVAPDIEVALDPVPFNQGDDVQLERAIQEVLSQLEDYRPIRRGEAPPLPTELGR